MSSHFFLSVDAPGPVLPPRGTIQARYLQGLGGLLHKLGRDPRDVLEHEQIDPATLAAPDHHIKCGAAVSLLEYCSRLARDPLFGLHLAERQEPEAFGCAVTLARAAPTLREGLQSLVDYVPVSTSRECELELVTAREVAELRWRTDTGFGDAQQPNYQGLLLQMKTLQMLGGRSFRPLYATLTFKVGRMELQPLQERLGCRVYGSLPVNAIAFPTDILDTPLVTSDSLVFGLLGSYLAQIRAIAKASLIEQVEAYVRSALSSGNCSVEGCAESLGTSARTLQKRLTRLRSKFADIVQNERINRAKHVLIWSDCTLDEIAFQLGYAEQTSFGRAFKRVTGMTPQAFRASESRKRLLS